MKRRKPAKRKERVKRRRGGANTNCPVCGHVTRVKQVRVSKEDGRTYRDRQCASTECGARFWTTEHIVTQEPADVRSRPESSRSARRIAGTR